MQENEFEQELHMFFTQPEDPIPDNGFTEKVLSALPHKTVPFWQRSAIIVTSAAAACFVVLFLQSGMISAAEAFMEVLLYSVAARLPPLSSVLIVAVVVCELIALSEICLGEHCIE